jgi:uncharacterized protein (TIGR00297 family)
MTSSAPAAQSGPPLVPPRRIVHMSMLGFAFLLPFLTWLEAAGAAALALGFNLFVLPRLGADLRKRPQAAAGAGAPDIWTGIVLYPVSVLLLILIYRHHMDVVAAVWAIMALGDGAAGVAGAAWGGPALSWNRRKTWAGSVAFVLAGTAGAWVLARWVNPELPAGKTVIICALTALVGAAVESLPISLDDNLSVPLVCGGFMFCAWLVERSAWDANLPHLGRRALLAAAVNLTFALVAVGLKTASRSGAALGFVLGWFVYLGCGWKSFLILFAFFLLGSLSTRLGYARKAARGLAERRGGARGWREALANVSAGAFFSILAISTRQQGACLAALVASFAEAAGDTVSSEIGQWLGGHTCLLTTLRPVPAGEEGGVSLEGSAAGLTAATLIAALGLALRLTGPGGAAVALAAALVGNLFDSLLGATLERRGLVTNGVVNFAGTGLAGALALAFTLR